MKMQITSPIAALASALAHQPSLVHDRAMLTGWQIKKGRELLDLSAKALGLAAGVGMATVQRAEAAGHEIPNMKTHSMKELEDYLRERVIFIEADDFGGPGVRLREAPKGGQQNG